MDEAEKIPVIGKVIWVAKKGAKSSLSPRVGVQCTDPDKVARDKIETHLACSRGLTSLTVPYEKYRRVECLRYRRESDRQRVVSIR